MEVIEHGQDLSQNIVCPTCGAKIKFQPGEVQQGVQKFYNVPAEARKCFGGEYGPCHIGYYKYILCPDCKIEVRIKG